MKAKGSCRPKVFAVLLAIGLTMFAMSNEGMARSVCATPTDMAALNARVLQTELMVAALSCAERARYNAFVINFKGVLQKHGRALRNLFNRAHGANGKRRMNGFVTKLANDASQKTLAIREGYCTKASALFDEVLATTPADFDTVASKPWIRERHGFSPCGRSATTSQSNVASRAD